MAARDPTSAYLRRWLGRVGEAPGPVLDLPGGHGRHTHWLLAAGYDVVSADLDGQRMARLAETARPQHAFLGALVLDAKETLPFRAGAFAGVVVTDFVCAPMLGGIAALLGPGGWLLFETFANRGENWRQLPTAGSVAHQLQDRFVLEDYRERPAGPAGAAVTVKCFARLKGA